MNFICLTVCSESPLLRSEASGKGHEKSTANNKNIEGKDSGFASLEFFVAAEYWLLKIITKNSGEKLYGIYPPGRLINGGGIC